MKQTDRTRIKICGLTRGEDVDAAVQHGADALGFVFYPPSKRCLTLAQAQELVARVPPFVATVALFVEPTVEQVAAVLRAMRPTYLQFHGDESVSACQQFDWPYLKAFRVGAPGLDTPTQLAKACQSFSTAVGWLFDSYTPAYGGSGHGFDRTLLKGVLAMPDSKPVILSGGLKSETVTDLAREIRPWAVDVSSGVELSAGVKSLSAMREFVAAVRRADADRSGVLTAKVVAR